MDKWINTLGSWASQLYNFGLSPGGGMLHITIQLYKTETNRKTKINQGKDRLTNIYLKNIYEYIDISHTHTCTYIHTYKHIHNTHIQQKTSQWKEHDTLGKQKKRTKLKRRKKWVSKNMFINSNEIHTFWNSVQKNCPIREIFKPIF